MSRLIKIRRANTFQAQQPKIIYPLLTQKLHMCTVN